MSKSGRSWEEVGFNVHNSGTSGSRGEVMKVSAPECFRKIYEGLLRHRDQICYGQTDGLEKTQHLSTFSLFLSLIFFSKIEAKKRFITVASPSCQMLEHLYNPYSRDYLRNAIYKTPGLEPLTCDVQTIEQIYLNYVQESDNISLAIMKQRI